MVHDHHGFFMNLAFCGYAFFHQLLCIQMGVGIAFQAAGVIGQVD